MLRVRARVSPRVQASSTFVKQAANGAAADHRSLELCALRQRQVDSRIQNLIQAQGFEATLSAIAFATLKAP